MFCYVILCCCMLKHAVGWYDIVWCMLHCTGSCYIALVLYGWVCAFFCQPKAGGTRKNNRTLCTRTRAGFNPPLLAKANLILMPFGQRNVFIKSKDLNSGDFIFLLIYIWVYIFPIFIFDPFRDGKALQICIVMLFIQFLQTVFCSLYFVSSKLQTEKQL